MNRLDTILAYAERGRPVYPLCEHTKVPIAGSHGFKDATTNGEQIRQWFGNGSKFNVAIPTGRVSGVLALDVDPRNGGGESLKRLIADHAKLPKTRMQSTCNGGHHALYRYPEGRHIASTALAGYPGIDIKAEGGGILVYPSFVPPENGGVTDGTAG